MVRLLTRGAIAGAVVLGAEAAYAVLRPAPELEQFDPSATFGDPANPELRVAVLGDSSVTAPGVAGPEEIWVSIVCRRLANGRFVDMRSFAVGGSMAHDLIDDQMGPALEFDPHLIYVTVGGNDVIKGVSKRRFSLNLDHLISELAESDALILQSGVGDIGTVPRLYPPLRTYISHRSAAFDQVHREIAERHGTEVVKDRFNVDPIWKEREMWAEDLFHVSAAGHQKWAETAWASLVTLLPELDARI